MPSKALASKKVTRTPKAAPFAKLVVADEFRVEQSGKVMGLGLYPDLVVVMQIPKGSPPPTSEIPYGIGVLSLLVTIGGAVGTFDVVVLLSDSKVVERSVTLAPGASVNLIIGLRPFLVQSFGTKGVTVRFAGKVFDFHYEVRALEVDGPLPEFVSVAPAASLPTVKPLRKKKRVNA